MTLEIGATATVEHVVGAEHTASAVGSGDVDVLATPQVLAWCEAATVAVVAGSLAADDTSVGAEIDLAHVRPTAVGATVRSEAVLTAVDGRRLEFNVSAHSADGQIATGRVVRVIVGRQRLVDRSQQP